MEQKFSAKIIGIKELGLTFVKAEFIDKNGEHHKGALLVDTGSTDCILNKDFIDLLPDASFISEDKKEIVDSNGTSQIFSVASFCFYIQGYKFNETFYVNKESNMNFCLQPGELIGIVGNQFMKKYGLVLDYEVQTLRLNDNDFAFDKSKYNYMFPLSFGMNKYRLPIITINGNDHQYLLIADSGCNLTTITKHVIDESCMEFELLGSSSTSVGLTSESDIKFSKAGAKLSLISYTAKNGELKQSIFNDDIQIVHNRNHIIEADDFGIDDALPISGMLSTPFMSRNRWIIDFSTGIIYSKKEAA